MLTGLQAVFTTQANRTAITLANCLICLMLATGAQAAPDIGSPLFYHLQTEADPFQRGRQYGSALGAEIQSRLDLWNALLEENTGSSGERLLEKLEASTTWLAAIREHAPHLLVEIEGIAAGAGVSAADLLTYNMAEEIISLYSQGYESCTNIALRHPSQHLLAYNFDIPDFLHGDRRPVVQQIGERYLLGFPGIIATTAITPHFSITTNSLSMLRVDPDGLPLPFMLRLLAEQPDLAGADALLASLGLAVPQNLMMVDANRVLNIESSAAERSVVPASPEDWLFHTNFPLLNGDYLKGMSAATLPRCERFDYLQQAFSGVASAKEISLQELQQSIFAVRDAETFFTVVVEYPRAASQRPTFDLFLPGSEEPAAHFAF